MKRISSWFWEVLTVFLAWLVLCHAIVWGGTGRTKNFSVSTNYPDAYAQQLADAMEAARKEIAVDFLGKELPDWTGPCPVQAKVGGGDGGCGGMTEYLPGDEVTGIKCRLSGGAKHCLSDTCRHEVAHMVLVSHFKRHPPAWFGEGFAVNCETISERHQFRKWNFEYRQKGERYGYRQLLSTDSASSFPISFYAHASCVVDLLRQMGGDHSLVVFLERAFANASGTPLEGTTKALKEVYGLESVEALGAACDAWLDAGQPNQKWIVGADEVYAFAGKQWASAPAPEVKREFCRRIFGKKGGGGGDCQGGNRQGGQCGTQPGAGTGAGTTTPPVKPEPPKGPDAPILQPPLPMAPPAPPAPPDQLAGIKADLAALKEAIAKIPAGAKGDTGPAGANGKDGPAGPAGPAGKPATVDIDALALAVAAKLKPAEVAVLPTLTFPILNEQGKLINTVRYAAGTLQLLDVAGNVTQERKTVVGQPVSFQVVTRTK